MFAAVRKTCVGFSVTGRFAGSNDRAALLLEDPERPGSERHEVAFRVVDLRFGRGGPAGAVENLALAGYATLADRTEEVHIHLNSRRSDAHEREHGETHRSIYERGVDPAVQRARTVLVNVLNGDAYDGASRLNLLDLSSYVSREGNLLVKIAC